MLDYLHFFDHQFPATEELHIGAAATAQGDGVGELDFGTALVAEPAARRFIDFEHSARHWCAGGANFEAEPYRIRDHARELANHQANAGHARRVHALANARNNALGDGQFVHRTPCSQPVYGRPSDGADARRSPTAVLPCATTPSTNDIPAVNKP